MNRRELARRLDQLEADRATSAPPDFDLTVLTDEELTALESAVKNGRQTPEAVAAARKARRTNGTRDGPPEAQNPVPQSVNSL